MTRTINLHAHDLDNAAWQVLVHDVRAAVAKARRGVDETIIGGTVHDSTAAPRTLTSL